MSHSHRHDVLLYILLADQAEQGGQIGLTLLGWWFEPQTPDDAAVAERMKEFHIGWLVPLYPQVSCRQLTVKLHVKRLFMFQVHPSYSGNYPPLTDRVKATIFH